MARESERIMSRFQVQGLVDGQWSWKHVGDSESATTFDSALDAQLAINDLVEVQEWPRSELRAVDPDDNSRVAIGPE